MTQNMFEKEIRRLLRRVDLLRQAASGSAKLRKIPITGHWVPRFYINPHSRYIAPAKKAA